MTASVEFLLDGESVIVPLDIDLPTETIITGSQPSGFTVPAGETWRIQGLVETPANVVVYGTLKMRAGDTLRFINVNEASYVGSGNVVLDSDIGLWVMGPIGVLDAQGTAKVGWNRTGTDPSWLSSDTLILMPTTFGDQTSVPYTGQGIPQAYSDVPAAEVLNLTRDCKIEGTPTGRSHIFITSPQIHTIKYVEVSHMGPRINNDVVTGRWPVHFHHGGDGTAGTVVQGVVVHDFGSYAFVPHDSNGIDYIDCVAYNGRAGGFWWDNGEPTSELRWINCVAANIIASGTSDPLAFGFMMHDVGENLEVTGCVAAAIRGSPKFSRGFEWGFTTIDTHWVHEDNVAHNCGTGARWWANRSDLGMPPPRTDRFVVYNNSREGIFQGAYRNPARHDDAILRGNFLEWHCNSGVHAPTGQTAGASRTDVDVAGLWPHALKLSGANLSASANIDFTECKFDGATLTAVEVDPNTTPRVWDFVRCTVNGADLEFADFLRLETNQPLANQTWTIRVQRQDGTAFQFGPVGGPSNVPGFA